MDDSSGHDMDSGFHRNELRFLGLLFGTEIGSGDFAGAAQLPRRGFRSREGVRVVFGACADVFSDLDGAFRGGVYGVRRLRSTVARHN